MGKMLNLLLFVVAIDFALIMFVGAYTPTNSLFLLVTDGIDWNDLALITKISTLLALVATIGVFIGTFWKAAPIEFIFAGISAIFLSYGIAIFEVYQRVTANEIFHTNNYLAALMVLPIVVSYIYFLLKFWRGND